MYFERIITINERSYEELCSGENYEEASSNRIFERRNDEEASSRRNFERSEITFGDSSHENDITLRNSCRDVFNNILDNMSEDSHEVSSQRREFDEKEYTCFKILREDSNTEVTNLTFK